MTDETTPQLGAPEPEGPATDAAASAGPASDALAREHDPAAADAAPASPQPWVAPPVGDAGIPTPAPAKRRGVLGALLGGVVGRIVVGVVVLGLFTGGAAIWRAIKDERQLGDLEVGQCVNVPDSREFATVKEVSCSSDHDAEIVAKLSDLSTLAVPSLGADGGLTGGTSPADSACLEAAAEYVDLDNEAYLELSYGYFSEADGGVRSDVVCYVGYDDGRKLSESVAAARE